MACVVVELRAVEAHKIGQTQLEKRSANRRPAIEDDRNSELQAEPRGERHLQEDLQRVERARHKDFAQSAAARNGSRSAWKWQPDGRDLCLFAAAATGLLPHESLG